LIDRPAFVNVSTTSVARAEDDVATADSAHWAPDRHAQKLQLIVAGEGGVFAHPLPARGRVAIGRGDANDVQIDHALISREHAILWVGPALEIEDLGSRNGIKVGGQRMASKSRSALSLGQVVELGATMLIVQAIGAPPRSQRLSTHAHFEARLDEMCSRARSGTSFSILRVHTSNALDPAVIEEVLAGAGFCAVYARGEYELLLADADHERGEAARKEIAIELGEHEVRIGIATFPSDGRSADALLERACATLRRPSTRRSIASEAEPIVLDPAMRDLYRVGERVAQGAISVLILGETGAGKEVFAEALHRMSPRRESSFVRINCAALAESLLESELFGFEKGAFTGATRAKPGLIEMADGGTLMLDEIGEMPPETQAKMLRVLEQRQVMRVGGLEPKDVDVRFLAATNRDLEAEVIEGRFRRDLFFRLAGVTLMIPPLRERKLEIGRLSERFLEKACADLGRGKMTIVPRAMSMLAEYSWPGNIRELKNAIERAVLLAVGDEIAPEHLPLDKMTIPWTAPSARTELSPPSSSKEETEERRRIQEALEQCGGNQTRAAKVLGIGRRTLTAKLTKYGMPRPKKG
jgi:DNA-binding NtrC family response regulator